MLVSVYICVAFGYIGKHASGTFVLTYSRADARSTAGESMRAYEYTCECNVGCLQYCSYTLEPRVTRNSAR